VHLIVGLGETEQDMAATMQRAADMGGETHLFSFYPEPGSQMAAQSPPPLGQYRRIQLARYLVDEKITNAGNFTFDTSGQIADFGIPSDLLEEIINTGYPFMTSGCKGNDGKVACNRPYANFPPPGHKKLSLSAGAGGYRTGEKSVAIMTSIMNNCGGKVGTSKNWE
jgi:biotin synthase-related radical SAM superfamily protein